MAVTNAEKLKEECGGIRWIEPSSPEYAAARRIYQQENTAVPLAIVQPENVEQVQQIVAAASKYAIKVTIRSGGHHIMGYCIEQDALCIDMRKLNSVSVADDKQSATIGGGANNLQVARGLREHGLVTPIGLVVEVGFVGWSTFGGYGSFMNRYGLGVDNIIGAEVVTWEGERVESDTDMLRGIRGAGGAFGVITALKVKTYPLKEKVLAGGLMFDYVHYRQFLRMLEAESASLPPALQIGTAIFNFPPGKKTLRAEIFWSGEDLDEGRRAIDHVISMSPPVREKDISAISLPDLILKISAMVPPDVHGGNHTTSIKTFDTEALDVVMEWLDKMPTDPATVVALHHLSPISPSAKPEADGPTGSSFPIRSGHAMIEFIGSVVDRSKADESKQWTLGFRDALVATGKTFEETYLSMTYPGDKTLAEVYGSKWENLKKLKEKFDPHGVFDLVVPRIRTGMS